MIGVRADDSVHFVCFLQHFKGDGIVSETADEFVVDDRLFAVLMAEAREFGEIADMGYRTQQNLAVPGLQRTVQCFHIPYGRDQDERLSHRPLRPSNAGDVR